MDIAQRNTYNCNYVIDAIIIIIVILFIFYNCQRKSFTRKELDEAIEIMTYFHVSPNYDDFIKIYLMRNYILSIMDRKYKFWFWGVYLSQPQFFNDEKIKLLDSYMSSINRGLYLMKNNMSEELIGCIWALYFATGDDEYPNIVKLIALNHQNDILGDFAIKSYESIIGKHPLND